MTEVLYAKTNVEIFNGAVYERNTETLGIETDRNGVSRLIYRNGFADPGVVSFDFVEGFMAA